MIEEKPQVNKKLKILLEHTEFFIFQSALLTLLLVEVVLFLTDRIGVNLSLKEIILNNINLLYISLGIIAGLTIIISFFTLLLKRDIKAQKLKNKIIAVYIESIENSSINPKNSQN